MKYAPKKVFILENGNYKEITYGELKQLEQADKSYMDKFFLPLHGMLMEVTEATYKEYYRDKRRQKYIDERSKLNGDVSYNALDTDETLGEDVFAEIGITSKGLFSIKNTFPHCKKYLSRIMTVRLPVTELRRKTL